MPPVRYRKRPVVVEAMGPLTGANADVIARWVLEASGRGVNAWVERHGVVIRTLEGDMLASLGDYVVRGVEGEFYPVKPSIFATTYEVDPSIRTEEKR